MACRIARFEPVSRQCGAVEGPQGLKQEVQFTTQPARSFDARSALGKGSKASWQDDGTNSGLELSSDCRSVTCVGRPVLWMPHWPLAGFAH